MDEYLLATDLRFAQDSDFDQLLEIARCGLAGGDFSGGHILDSAVRKLEDQVDQFVAVYFWSGLANVLDGLSLR